ncbi:MAG: alcohol dehydrogenase catalytic domain-containing protein [Deltaproteobacteria bacterium]|nr:alcohol dehydrogenase catalytic domain-containing protein [Deltaproteobacteria bacterium]
MLAARLTGPKHLELIETEDPVADGQSVIIKVKTCGICGSDLHYWETGLDMCGKTGLIMGHEFCGTVVENGSRIDLRPGDRVTALPLDPCGICGPCRKGLVNLCTRGMKRSIPGNNSQGAFAQYLKLRPDMVRILPDTISENEAAMIEPAAVALHAVRQASSGIGDRVLITGGGTIGLLCAAWARIAGASYIALSEINKGRRVFARELSYVDEVFDAGDPGVVSAMKKAVKSGFDIAIDTSASDAGINTTISALKSKGRLVLAGISFHPQSIFTLLIVVREIEMKTSLGYIPEEFDLALESIASKTLHVGNLINKTIPIEDLQKAFENLASGVSCDVKIILEVT